MNAEVYRKGFFALVFLFLIFVSYLIIKPFITPILAGVVLSYIAYPLYQRINNILKMRNISSFIACVLVVLIISLPLIFTLNTISKEAYTTYLLSRQKLSSGTVLPECKPTEKLICRITNSIATKLNEPKTRYHLETTITQATSKVTESISNIVFTIPRLMINLFIMLFVMFFLFRDGDVFVDKIERILPLKMEDRKKVVKRLSDTAYAVIYGSLVIAIAQGTLGGIGFFIFGVPSPILWGLVMMLASLIPYIGSSIVWLPASLMLIINGYIDMETGTMIRGLLLIFYGLFIVSTIDNILKPKIIGDKSGLHPVLVLLGVVGGLKLFGFIGVIIGPIILALLVTFIKIYEEEKGSSAQQIIKT